MNAKGNEPQTTIVTGASSGIGLGVTQALLERGYCVVGNSPSISKSKELRATGHLVLVDGDIGKKNTAIKVADAAIRHFGRMKQLGTLSFKFKKPIFFLHGWLAVLFLNLASPCVCNGGFEINAVSVE